jgi:hypothetical protein
MFNPTIIEMIFLEKKHSFEIFMEFGVHKYEDYTLPVMQTLSFVYDPHRRCSYPKAEVLN